MVRKEVLTEWDKLKYENYFAEELRANKSRPPTAKKQSVLA